MVYHPEDNMCVSLTIDDAEEEGEEEHDGHLQFGDSNQGNIVIVPSLNGAPTTEQNTGEI